MEKLIESRGQYDELRYKVGEELRTIQNVRDLLGGDCIKEEYNKYIKALHALKRVFVFSVEEKGSHPEQRMGGLRHDHQRHNHRYCRRKETYRMLMLRRRLRIPCSYPEFRMDRLDKSRRSSNAWNCRPGT